MRRLCLAIPRMCQHEDSRSPIAGCCARAASGLKTTDSDVLGL
jgi:hypothetical protein